MKDFAIIFDLDGVLTDSGDLHIKAWVEFAHEHQLPFDEAYFWSTFGQRNREIIPHIFGGPMSAILVEEKSEYKEALFRKLARGNLRALPGAQELVEELKRYNIPMSIGSSTPGSNLAFFRQELSFLSLIDGYVCGDDVRVGKPNPEVFLKAGAINKLPPQNQIVVEDAIAGIQAAKAGGFKCVAVATTETRSVLEQTDADLVIDRMDELSVKILSFL